jgi:hypothetical protein
LLLPHLRNNAGKINASAARVKRSQESILFGTFHAGTAMSSFSLREKDRMRGRKSGSLY